MNVNGLSGLRTFIERRIAGAELGIGLFSVKTSRI